MKDAILDAEGWILVGDFFNAKAPEWEIAHPDCRGKQILEMVAITALVVFNTSQATKETFST